MLSKLSKRIVGHRVKIVAWEHADFIASFLERTHLKGALEGTIIHIDSYGASDGDVWVQVDGLKREYVFGPKQLELLPH